MPGTISVAPVYGPIPTSSPANPLGTASTTAPLSLSSNKLLPLSYWYGHSDTKRNPLLMDRLIRNLGENISDRFELDSEGQSHHGTRPLVTFTESYSMLQLARLASLWTRLLPLLQVHPPIINDKNSSKLAWTRSKVRIFLSDVNQGFNNYFVFYRSQYDCCGWTREAERGDAAHLWLSTHCRKNTKVRGSA